MATSIFYLPYENINVSPIIKDLVMKFIPSLKKKKKITYKIRTARNS